MFFFTMFLLGSPLPLVNVGNQLKKSPTRDSNFDSMLGTFNIDLGGREGEKLIFFNFENSSFMFCQKFDLTFICASGYLYFLIGHLTQNIYIGKFSDVNIEINVTNVRN